MFYMIHVFIWQSQYRLIYDTLAMYVQVWNTVIPSAKLPAVAHKLMLKDPQTDLLGFEKEFQVFIFLLHCNLYPLLAQLFQRKSQAIVIARSL